ncbi:hypothetical protein INT43_004354 [Umbelopsis isabellina]|uniref:Uncharacterized protein n=1 Tax=Mortierella isabellina TaxID=91625 RepID=A0A8H7PJA7_MORIS|nr:hypothetical protein INT43_004354 [Umbelopsis isabellina]
MPSTLSRPAQELSQESTYNKSEKVEVYQLAQSWMDSLFSSWKVNEHSYNSDPDYMSVEHVQEEDDKFTYSESSWSTTVRTKGSSATLIPEKPASSIRHKKILTISLDENMEKYSEFDLLNNIAPTSAPTL